MQFFYNNKDEDKGYLAESLMIKDLDELMAVIKDNGACVLPPDNLLLQTDID